MTRKAILFGYYGAANSGDELLLAQVLQWLRDMQWEAVVVSRNPDYTQRVFQTEAIDFSNLGSVAVAMSGAQIVIFGGGGIFQDHHPFRRQALFNPSENDISAYGRFIHLAQQYNRPVVLLGLGLGPLRSDDARQITCDLYERVARFTLRDEASAELLRDIGVKRPILVAPDIGWSYAVRWAREHLPLTTESSSPKLAIVLRHWDGEALWQERLAEALTGCIPPTWQIELVGFQQSVGPGDVTSDEPTLVRMAERCQTNSTSQAPSDLYDRSTTNSVTRSYL
ncbi:MAG: hypothetical protein EON54_26525, partial [Alcaligenaceae bacterium]